ncbi:MAG: SNF2-related protein [Nitrososphaera sp.]
MRHQEEALEKCANAKVFGYLMGVGTGKTFTLLEDAYRLYQANKIEILVVVAPKVLCIQWCRAIDEYYNNKNFNYRLSYRSKILKLFSNKLSIFIINVESFSRKAHHQLDNLIKQEYKKIMVAIDESTKIKNINAQRTKTILKVFHQAEYKRILTGSIITECIVDAYAQFTFLSKDIFPYSLRGFQNMFTVQQKMYGPFGSFTKTLANRNMPHFTDTINPLVFQIAIEDCVDLPGKIYNNFYITLSDATRVIYNKLFKDMIYELKELDKHGQKEILVMFALLKFHKLHEIISRDDSKFKAIDQIIETHPHSKIIIWCSHLNEVALLRNSLQVSHKDKSIGVIADGEYPKEAEKKDILVVTMQSGSYGLNFQDFNVNIYFNRMYSMAVKIHSEARSYRIGTKQKVFYYDIIAENTIDNDTLFILDKKHILISDLIDKLNKTNVQDER